MRTFFSLCVFITAISLVKGQGIVEINKMPGTINFDGIPDEATWQLANEFELTMHSPDYGGSPEEASRVFIGFDDRYLWVAAFLDYRDPVNIVSTSKKRDEESKNPDSFGIILDTYNDNENALAFFTMPAGQRIDFTVSNDGVDVPSYLGMTNINYSWNTYWDVKTTFTQAGWSAEIRIPFSSLRFQPVNGKVQMGLILNRTISHCNEIDTYPVIDPRHGRLAPTKPSLAATIELNGIKESKPIYISPYVIAGKSSVWELNETESGFNRKPDKTFNAGLDLKYSLTSNLTMDITVNTDFAQVESDDAQVNLTRYSLFYPEKRMFFQERSSIFNFSLGGAEQLFYSRRIGLTDDGPVPIFGGARLTGRMGKWDLGAMDMQTGEKYGLPSENFGVFRFRRQVVNTNSYVGAILTSRIETGGSSSFSYGADGIFRVFGDDYFQFNLAQTTDTTGNNFTTSKSASFLNFSWERRNQKGFAYDLSYSFTGDEFDPKMGFIMRSGVRGAMVRTQYGWMPGPESKLFNYSLSFFYAQSNRLENNGLEMLYLGPGFSFQTKSGWNSRLGLSWYGQGIYEEFFLSDHVKVPVGEYRYFGTRISFATPFTKPVSSEFRIEAGEFYDGENFTLTAEPKINVSASVQLSGFYNFNHVVFTNRSQELIAHVGRLKMLYMYNTKLSASSFIQFNSVDNLVVSNFRLRYNPKEGNDFYLVYNEIRPTSGYFEPGISKTKFLDQIVQLKYVHTFKL